MVKGKCDVRAQFIGTSKPMRAVYEKISKIAPTSAPVFIKGESGTGKDICAKMIHDYSDYSAQPFIAINCAALPSNLVESALFGHVKGAFTGAHESRDGAIAKANGGTLFLDEIGDMSLELQAKLLRFCQDYTYQRLGSDKPYKANIRLLCATNKDVEALVFEKKFREDFYYRLNVTDITLPPLRQRQNDIIDIAQFYLHFYAQKFHKNFYCLSEEVEQIFLTYDWPGNVRELQNIIQKIVIMEIGTLVTTNMLPDIMLKNTPHHHVQNDKQQSLPTMPLWKIEKNAIEKAIDIANGDIPKAATMLDIAPSTIYRKLKLWKNKPL